MIKFRLTLQRKIVFFFLIVVIVGGSVALILGTVLYGQTVLERAQNQVKIDLNSAWMLYNQQISDIKLVMELTAKREGIIRELHQRNIMVLKKMLEEVRRDSNLDFLTLTDERGVVMVRTRSPYKVEDNQSNDEMVKKALNGANIAGTQILSQGELVKEGEGLAEQAFMIFVETPLSTPLQRDQETAGMVIKAAIPVIDKNDGLQGVIYGGILLNRNHEIVDRIKDVLYRGESYEGKDIGTATIFQWDVRISTNVKNSDGLRAIGTRVSHDVYERVLVNGLSYIGHAYVVNAGYITAYEPISDVLGKIVGILYVGVLEQPFTDMRNQVIFLFFAIALIGVLVALIMGYFLAKSISKPVEKLVHATQEISQGNFPARLDISSDDEIGRLSYSFNQMSQSLQKTMSDLKELNKKYLGLLGFTTHELKQPLGVLKGYLIMLQDETLGKLNTAFQKEALLEMKNNINTLTDMIQKYLQLTKIEAGQLMVEKRRINIFKEAIEPVLEGEMPHLTIKKMQIVIDEEEKFKQLKVLADPILMKIVFSNLITNAIKYGNTEGFINLGFQDQNAHYLFHVKNEGPGIPKEKLAVIFDKFMRIDIRELGKQLGTGLGLYNTKEIIEKHSGKIWAESEEGKWANFIFTLPKQVE